MIEDKPYDFVELGFMIGCYEHDPDCRIGYHSNRGFVTAAKDELIRASMILLQENSEDEVEDRYAAEVEICNDLDLTVAKLGDMGFETIRKVILDQDVSEDKLLDYLNTAIAERWSDDPEPKRFFKLGLTAATLAIAAEYSNDSKAGESRSSLWEQLEHVGLSEVKLTVEPKSSTNGDTEPIDLLRAIEEALVKQQRNIPYSSPENIRTIDIILMMRPRVWSSLPEISHAELKDAERQINNGDYRAATYPLSRSVEFAFRELYHLVDRPVTMEHPSWDAMERKLMDLGRSDRKYQNLSSVIHRSTNFRKDYRNPNEHNRLPIDGWYLRGMLYEAIEVLSRISDSLELYQ